MTTAGSSRSALRRTDLVGKEHQQRDRDQRHDQGAQARGEVPEPAGDVGQPRRPGHLDAPHVLRPDQRGGAAAPAVLLAHERVQRGRADSGRQRHGEVDQLVAGVPHVEPGVGVLGVRDLGEPAHRVERRPPVHGVGADAQRRAEPVPRHLHGPVEHLQGGARGPLYPGLAPAGPEELRGLHDPDTGIVQVRQRLGQEVRPGPEVGVEYHDVLAARPPEGVVEVARLLVLADDRAAHVGEPEPGGLRPGLLARAVIQHIDVGGARVGLHQLEDTGPGVAQDLDRLAADGQEDVHRRVARRPPGADQRLVRGQVEAAAGEVHRQAHQLVDEVGDGIGPEQRDRVREHMGVPHLEPHLGDDQAQRRDGQRRRQQRQRPPCVGVLLGVAGRLGENMAATTGAAPPGGLRSRSSPRTLTRPEQVVALERRCPVGDPGDQPVAAVADDAVQDPRRSMLCRH